MSGKIKKSTASVISISAARDEPNYYELLQLEPDASHAEIVNAHRRAKETYKQNSLTTYSLFDDEEMEKMLAQIDEAYHVLAQPGKRRLYDQAHTGSRRRKTATKARKSRGDRKKPTKVPSQKRKKEFERLVAETRVFSGAALKTIREHRKIPIDEIADRTKICKTSLLAIENEEATLLPSRVYLKSFLRQYANELGLDPEAVAETYPPLQDNSLGK